jgi:HD-GYP domain-containing protein (c-di-GMP phosphodiesterase class II)
MIEGREHLLDRYFDPIFLERLVKTQPLLRKYEWAVYEESGRRKAHVLQAGTHAHFPQSMAPGELSALSEAHLGTTPLVRPIIVEAGLIGYLALHDGDTAHAVQHLGPLAGLAAALCGAHVNNRQTASDLSAELAARYEELALVYQMAEFMNLKQDAVDSVHGVADAVASTLDAEHLVMSVPAIDLRIERPTAHPRTAEIVRWLINKTAGSGEPFAYNDLHDHPIPELEGIAHLVAVPLVVDGDPGICIIARSDPANRFFMGDVKLLQSISRQIEIFLTNTKVTEARRQLFDLTIFGLARLAESRDPETGAHLERVGSYCEIVARALLEAGIYTDEVDEDFVETIALSSSLHDIGKVGVPDAVLQKPGKLTAEEFEIMKEHARIGGDTLLAIERHLNWGESTFLTMGRQIAYCHHEKWDGSGYPNGISGFDIPLPARIMALADVYDALTSKRCYKDAFTHLRAAQIIHENKGKHFDPVIVDMFDRSEALFIAARERIEAGMGARELAMGSA